MASNSLQNNNKIPLHYLDYSVINPLITTPPHSYPSHFLNQNDNNHDLNQINNDAINGDFNDDGVVWNGNGVVEIGVGVFENVWGVLEKSDFGVSLWCFWSGFCDCDVKNG